MGLLLWVIPVIAVLLIFIIKNVKALHIVSVTATAVMAGLAGWLTSQVVRFGPVTAGAFYADALSVIVLDTTLVIVLLASIYSIGYLSEEIKHGKLTLRRLKHFYELMFLFVFSMVLALTAQNMGIMWIAIEATTLASAFLVGFNNDKQALEAAWKYVIICSVGIAVAMLGIILLHLSSAGALGGEHLLDWTALYSNAGALDSGLLRLGFLFILIGFGTKAGLAPMHTWLPDAHSQAPSPISALLSGVLLNSAMYAIIRAVAIVNRNLGGSKFTGTLLIALGFLSIGTAVVFIITQKDYKRLLAYSSIEHMGVIAFGLGIFTPAAVFGSLFHMVNHSFTKSMLFLSSGSILQKYGTRDISKVRDLLRVLPVTGTAFFLGLFAIAGTPPFSVFSSEFNIIAAVFEQKRFVEGTVFAVLLALVFAGIALTLFKIFHGKNENESVIPGDSNLAGTIVIVLLLAAIAAGGLFMPGFFKTLLTDAQRIIIGGPLS